ncbi:MAG: FAD-dependent oxidoreductase [Candidatus Brocadiae bacterium]|nr:FAD-dependent oxidoreductase [Candidatus Brocadiia bacterium]
MPNKVRIYQIALPFDHDEKALQKKALEKTGFSQSDIIGISIVKRSMDTRFHKKPGFIYCLDIEVKEGVRIQDGLEILPQSQPHEDIVYGSSRISHRPVVVGTGPGGLFAAYWLAQNGYSPLILEQGQEIGKRKQAIENFHNTRIMSPTSNYVFGEGGAGSYSDGKLNTGVTSGYIAQILKIMVDCGAPHEILYVSPPHIGSDRLRAVIIQLRKRIIEWGGEFRFETKVTNLIVHSGKIAGVVTDKGEIPADLLVLATGSHDQDTFAMLSSCGIFMEKKPFQMGVRIEHPQEFIDKKQYGKYSGCAGLPPANYRLVGPESKERCQVCTFCMCPGGEVMAGTGTPGFLSTNGMSNYRRDSGFANAALITTFFPEEMEDNPLAGLFYRQKIEKAAFLAGKGDYTAPAQNAGDFISDRLGALPATSYRFQVKPVRISSFMPEKFLVALKKALPSFEEKMPGFISSGLLIAPETRASCPIKITRDKDSMQSLSCQNLYPVGEGAGYAGGIISAALDGIKAAKVIISTFSRPGMLKD